MTGIRESSDRGLTPKTFLLVYLHNDKLILDYLILLCCILPGEAEMPEVTLIL